MKRSLYPVGYLGAVLMIALGVYLPFVVWAWWDQPAEGDLVRIGGWSARAYGWNAPQPQVSVRHNRGDREGASVWVLGDSFSEGNVWQSVWAEKDRVARVPQGAQVNQTDPAPPLRVYTQGYQGHGCIDAFVDQAVAAAGHGPGHVVIQSIERHLLDRFREAAICPAAGAATVEGPAGQTAVVRSGGFGRLQSLLAGQVWAGNGSWLPKVDWRHLARAQFNEARVRIQRSAPPAAPTPPATPTPPAAPTPEPRSAGPPGNPGVLRSGDTLNSALSQPGLFSSRQADRVLYYLGDEAKREWSAFALAEAAAYAALIQKRLREAGLHFTLLVVPDKSSVYRPWMPHATHVIGDGVLLEVFAAAGVNLAFPLAEMRVAAMQAPDFYLPDDTHLSAAGFAWLGEFMATTAAQKARAQ